MTIVVNVMPPRQIKIVAKRPVKQALSQKVLIPKVSIPQIALSVRRYVPVGFGQGYYFRTISVGNPAIALTHVGKSYGVVADRGMENAHELWLLVPCTTRTPWPYPRFV